MAKTHPNCPRAHHPLKKERKKNSFAGSKVPSVGWVTPFTWNVCIFSLFHKALSSLDYISSIVECSMILLRGVKSGSSVQADAERGGRWAAPHRAGRGRPRLREPEWASYSSGKVQVRESGSSWPAHNRPGLQRRHSCCWGGVEKNHPHTRIPHQHHHTLLCSSQLKPVKVKTWASASILIGTVVIW